MDNNKQRIKDLEAIIAICTGLIVFAFIFEEKENIYRNFLILAGIIGILSILSKFFVKYLALIWMKLAEGMGYVMSKVVLSSIYYLILSPIAAIYRLTNKNNMKARPKIDSVFENRNHKFNKNDFDNPW